MEYLNRALDYLNKYSSFGEAYYADTHNSSIVFKNGSLTQVSNSSSSGYSFRSMNRSFGFGATNSNEWINVKDILDKVIDNSMLTGRNSFSKEDTHRENWKIEQKKKIHNMDIDEKIDILKDSDKILQDNGIPMRILALNDVIHEDFLINTDGTELSSKVFKVSFFMLMGYQEGGQFEQRFIQLGYSGGYEALEYWKLFDTIEEESKALKKAVVSKGIEPGKYDMIISPEIAGIVAHESAGHPMELDRILGREMAQAGESFINVNDEGTRIGSKIVNVVDDPTFPNSFGYYKYDRDGVKARKRYLYREGRVSEFLSNRESSGRIGKKSTSASRVSEWDKDPLPRMSTTYIEPGEFNFDELLEDIKDGIYMKSYTEWNIDDIRYNEKYVGLEAYRIKNGEITDQIRRPTLETTTVKFYSAIDAIGNDLKFYAGTCGKGDPMQGVDVWMGGPHVRLRNMDIR